MTACCTGSADTVIKAGTARLFTVEVVDKETGDEINISTSSAITYSLARSIDDLLANILISKSLGAGITILPLDATTNPNQNKYVIKLDGSDTAPLLGNYYHESELIDVAGNSSRFINERPSWLTCIVTDAPSNTPST